MRLSCNLSPSGGGTLNKLRFGVAFLVLSGCTAGSGNPSSSTGGTGGDGSTGTAGRGGTTGAAGDGTGGSG